MASPPSVEIGEGQLLFEKLASRHQNREIGIWKSSAEGTIPFGVRGPERPALHGRSQIDHTIEGRAEGPSHPAHITGTMQLEMFCLQHILIVGAPCQT